MLYITPITFFFLINRQLHFCTCPIQEFYSLASHCLPSSGNLLYMFSDFRQGFSCCTCPTQEFYYHLLSFYLPCSGVLLYHYCQGFSSVPALPGVLLSFTCLAQAFSLLLCKDLSCTCHTQAFSTTLQQLYGFFISRDFSSVGIFHIGIFLHIMFFNIFKFSRSRMT